MQLALIRITHDTHPRVLTLYQVTHLEKKGKGGERWTQEVDAPED